MTEVFNKARELSPSVIILEDLDSLINDSNRSFFLNQVDGLEGNDGLLIIGTTNHFDRLDPGLSTRPSRFDRKLYVIFAFFVTQCSSYIVVQQHPRSHPEHDRNRVSGMCRWHHTRRGSRSDCTSPSDGNLTDVALKRSNGRAGPNRAAFGRRGTVKNCKLSRDCSLLEGRVLATDDTRGFAIRDDEASLVIAEDELAEHYQALFRVKYLSESR